MKKVRRAELAFRTDTLYAAHGLSKKVILRRFGRIRGISLSISFKAWRLVIVGEGPLRDELEELIRDLGIESSVRFLGKKGYAELPAIYGLAEALVLSSSTDQWGLAVNEGMAAGLPVIVSSGAGCSG